MNAIKVKFMKKPMKVKIPVYVDTDSKMPYQGGRVEKLAHQLMDEQISKTSKKKIKLQLNSLYGQFGKRGKPDLQRVREELSSYLIDIKIANAALKCDKDPMGPINPNYAALSDVVIKLYDLLRVTPIASIERAITGA